MEKPKKNTCFNCAYRTDIPGDAHIGCSFAWEKSENKPPKANEAGVKNGWYMFPLNFDPVWQEEPCKEHSDTKKPEMVTQVNPLQAIISMLKR